MDASLGTVAAFVRLDTKGLDTGAAHVKRKVGEIKRDLADVGQAFTNAGRSLTLGLTAPLGLFAGAAVNASTRMDSLKRGLTAVAGSSQEAERQLVRLREVAKLPGLGFEEAIQGSIRLQAAGLSAQLAERALKGFGNAIATVGGGKEELDGVTRALGQIAAKGQVFAEEINQLNERIPQIRQVMKDAFGTASTEELAKMGLTADQFLTKVTEHFEKLPQVVGGAKNSFENFRDTSNEALRAVGDAILPVVTAFLEKLTPAIQSVANQFRALPDAVKAGLGGLAIGGAIIGPALLGIGLMIDTVGKLKKAFDALGGSVGLRLIALRFGPAGIAAAAATTMAAIGVSEAGSITQQVDAAKKNIAEIEELERILKSGKSLQSVMGGMTPKQSILQQQRIQAMQGQVYDPFTGKVRPMAPTITEDQRVFEMAQEAAKEEMRKAAEERRKDRERELREHRQHLLNLAELRNQEVADLQRSLDAISQITQKRLDRKQVADELEGRRNSLAIERITNQNRTELELAQKQFAKEEELREMRRRRLQEDEEDLRAAMRRSIGIMQSAPPEFKIPARSESSLGTRNALMPGLTEDVGKLFHEELRKGLSMRERFRALQDQMREGFHFIPELFSSLADEAYTSFAKGMEDVFGRNPLGRSLARVLNRWMSTILDDALAAGLTEIGGGLVDLFGGGKKKKGGGFLGEIAQFAPLLGFFADGGRPPVGRLSVVGEKGPELFVPDRPGTIIPNGAMGGNVSINFTGPINLSGDADIRRLSQRIAIDVQRVHRARPGRG